MLKTGEILQERYQIQEKLGNNIAHEVWLAKDIKIKPTESVVVKVLSTRGATQWEEFKLFEREAKILKQLNHPYIPRYLDYFPLNESIKGFVLVQEYIPGNSFKDLILQEKRFTESQIKEIAKNVLNILIYLHELNPPVLHRDIKPSNLICGKDGHIYLIDFGAVQYRAAVEGSTFTVVGTYGYTPIEQFGGRAVAASDIYALGTTLIHLLTGIPPADLPQEDFKIQFADRVNLSPNLVRWLRKAIEPDLKKRFDTAKTALKELQSGIFNDDNSSIQLSQKSYYAKDIVPSKTNVELEKSLDKLTITYPSIEVNYIYLLVAIFYIIGASIISIFFGLSAAFFLLLSSCGTFYMIPEPRDRLLFHNNLFEIYEHNKLIGGGSITEIEDVNSSSDNFTIESWFISIKTQKQRYAFGHGLTKAESIWLVQEIKNWLEQN
ncbi:serine/threonine protein kinase [Rivularia sp. PCC 7116]|uniref:serine/threonine protein kinase n=1 Tax=Rivularia sp. PCC 7116 TaxID=373994 RepID=UPI00029F109C|nr:serine/threonine-protein kinase [Rivularia sp. PCC 7116]AFY58336.1 serine/threonine protein kinase [Rivularia sp. PCC 7116]